MLNQPQNTPYITIIFLLIGVLALSASVLSQKWDVIVLWSEKYEHATVTLSTAVIAVFTLVLSLGTLALFWSSEKVAEAAKTAAEAAQESSDATKRTLIAAHRPWVSIEQIEITESLDITETGGSAAS